MRKEITSKPWTDNNIISTMAFSQNVALAGSTISFPLLARLFAGVPPVSRAVSLVAAPQAVVHATGQGTATGVPARHVTDVAGNVMPQLKVERETGTAQRVI